MLICNPKVTSSVASWARQRSNVSEMCQIYLFWVMEHKKIFSILLTRVEGQHHSQSIPDNPTRKKSMAQHFRGTLRETVWNSIAVQSITVQQLLQQVSFLSPHTAEWYEAPNRSKRQKLNKAIHETRVQPWKIVFTYFDCESATFSTTEAFTIVNKRCFMKKW